MDELTTTLQLAPPPPDVTVAAAPPRRRSILPRWLALAEVIVVSGLPTQFLVMVVLILGTNLPILDADNNPTFEFFAMLSLLDTALIALLLRVFLILSGETSARVFVGLRPIKGELLRGLVMLPIVTLVTAGVGLLLRWIAPWTHNVAVNPYDRYMHSPIEATIFVVVVVLAGGIREELQRAFTLHRFGQRLGGMRWGLAIYSIVFMLPHLVQGIDAAIQVGLLGVFWGVVYIRRRSAVANMVSHAGFDAAQVVLGFFTH